MSWFRVDDKSAFHRKVLAAGNEAWGALCRAGAMSSGEGTDGRVTRDTCLAIAPKRVWDRLVDVGLAERVDGSGDLVLHDFLQWNPSAAAVAEAIERKREAGRRGGIRSGVTRSKNEADASARADRLLEQVLKQDPSIIPTQPNHIREPPVVPLAAPPVEPSPPSPERSSAEPDSPKAKRGTRCPASTDPEAHVWLIRQGIPALSSPSGLEVAKMLDHFAAASGQRGTKLDWPATWRNWEREAERRAGRGRGGNGFARPVQPIGQRPTRTLADHYRDNPPIDDEAPF